MLKALAWVEIGASVVLLGLALWPFSGFCAGRFMGLDCESRAIFGVLMFGPIGLLALVGSVWTLKTESWVPQLALLLGVLAVMGYWLVHAF